MPPKLKAQPKLPARRGAASAAASAAATPAPPPAQEPAPSPNPPNDSQTPAPAPSAQPEASESPSIVPPKGRLDSLAPRNTPSGPSIPNTKGPLKFKPKVVARKTKEERENLEAKFAAQASESAAPPRGRGGHRGRGGRGRGRGGFDRHDSPAVASGPFALGSVITGRKKTMNERGDDITPQRSGQVRARVKSEDGVKKEYSSSDESDTERMDIEFISALDIRAKAEEEEEDAMEDEWGDGAPVRIERRQHLDRQAMVNTDSSTRKGTKAEAKAKEKEVAFETEMRIKEEPVEEDPGLPPELVPTPRSPESKRKSGKRARRRSSANKKPVLSTKEEEEEFERAENDRMWSLRELTGKLPGQEQDKDGDVTMGDEAHSSAPGDRNPETENQIFFFQFPTMLPKLVPAIKPEPKPEPDDVAAPAAAPDPNTTNDPVDLTKAAEPTTAPKKGPSLKARAAELQAPPPSGLLGQLRVHKSGRVTMLWGDPSASGDEGAFEMEVQRGADCGFLQEVVIMKEQSPYGDEDKDEKGRRNGVVFSLGQVKGKYVVSPDFNKLIAASAKKEDRKRKGKAAVVKKEEG